MDFSDGISGETCEMIKGFYRFDRIQICEKDEISIPGLPRLLSSGHFALAGRLVAHLAGGAAIACSKSDTKIRLGLHRL